MPLTLYSSNRLENLEILLFRQMELSPGGHFFTPREIIVPGAALRQRLTLEYARQFGICAHVRFFFLAHWVWDKIRLSSPEIPEQSPLAAETLVWRILNALDRQKSPSRLTTYLQHSDERMRFELAQQLAGLFERYATYRPHWLTAWAQGRQPADLPGHNPIIKADALWQAALWQSIASGLQLSPTHPVESFLKRLQADSVLRQRILPHQLTVFALPAIPPVYLRALNELAQWMDIDLYSLNPCREYWFRITDPRRASWLHSPATRTDEEGHPLLAAWGQSSRSALELLFEETSGQASEATLFLDPIHTTQTPSTLIRLQSSLLALDIGQAAGLTADDSLVIHACHGNHRQIQVLHDQLLDMLAKDPSLTPADILVLAPQLPEMAEAIKAVFGSASGTRHIPFHLTGLPSGTENSIARLLSQLLELPTSRFEASRLMDLLEEPLLAERFALHPQALEWIRQWIQESGIRWGRDARDRSRHGAPASERHTFAQGLSRLLLGYTLPQGQQNLVAGLLPTGNVEGESALVLGRFCSVIDHLSSWVDRLNRSRSPEDWCVLLHQLLEQFLDPEQAAEGEWQAIRRQIEELGKAWKTAAFDRPLPLEVVRIALSQTGATPNHVPGAGVLTFAPLAALRNLPNRVICLLGMNDDFPGDPAVAEFDLIAQAPRKGDRQSRQDDRALFLDALLSARERLLLFFNGRSEHNDEEIPPSVLIEQLLNSLGWERAQQVIAHPLQPFSRRYFSDQATDDRLFSYVQEYAQALNGKTGEAPLLPADMDLATEDEEEDSFPNRQPLFYCPCANPTPVTGTEAEADLAYLLAFFRNPSRHWLKNGLQLDLPQTREELEDVEPLALDSRSRRLLLQQLFTLCLAHGHSGPDAATAQAHALADNGLPEGTLGVAAFDEVFAEARALAQRVREATGSIALPPAVYAFSLPTTPTLRLAGSLPSCHAEGLIRYRAAPLSSMDELALWLEHLVLCSIRPACMALHSQHIALDADIHFDALPADEAQTHLAHLAAFYIAGGQAPLPFFPRSAFAWAETWQQAQQASASPPSSLEETCLRAARRYWQNGRAESWSEHQDVWHRIATRGVSDPLTQTLVLGEQVFSFSSLARSIFVPLLDGPRRKIRHDSERPS